VLTTNPIIDDFDVWLSKRQISTVQHTVLVVDDDPRIRSSVRRALRSEPYDLLLADSGQQALKMMTDRAVQVVVSDMGMPEMGGIELLVEVAERSPDAICMVLSGQSDTDIILEAINSGKIYQYILKPWDNDHLKIVIRQALDLWALRQERESLMYALQTYNRHLEELIAQRTRQMLAVERQADIGRYASQIVHNLSNPLNAISGSLELLATYVDGNQLDRKKLERILTIGQDAASDLREMIVGILNHAGETERTSMIRMDVNPLIEKEIAFFDMIPGFKYKIDKQLLLDPLVGRIRGNPIQIKQILDNLIKNALDAMEDAPVKQLTVQTTAEKDWVVLRIKDTGHGITPEHIERIFAADFTTKPVGKGTGLGLASVKTMMAAYSGTIQVASEVNKGTTFTLRFPALPDNANRTQFFERAAS
jgi:signal transduction histidine kinase